MKFLTDSMFGKLTRFLRIFSYDTVYANDLIDVYELDPIPDDILREFAEKTNRIVITRDYPFHNKIPDKSIYLEGEGVYNFLKQLKEKLDLEYNIDMQHARCSLCNSELKKIENKNEIKDELNESTYLYYDTFYQCVNPECQKIFWNGPHIEEIKRRLKSKLISGSDI
ncbi:MAG: hypothetical protein BAJALOKI3v1_700011 [Promethearchaeota archaeon]|nr:MAG: hypothetical protein BAJALOKI3v1_700011 [Candidatus Lokiarchaeota archaeon]